MTEITTREKSVPVTNESTLSFEVYFRDYYLPWCRKRQVYYETMKKYFLNVVPDWFKQLKLNQISTKESEMLQSYFMEKDYTIATVNRYFKIFLASMTKAYEWDLISEQRLKAIR
ncbi:hypothetical protein V4D30_01175 [Thermodesulfovibrio sp. 3907-1M]|uniref:Core-binding (CB) domain-containing protein n=1 Tax=Thermodesulfovibrio autotrophicus TaxID=3118333 RepID=A0AAU8GX18_9BACT